MIWGEPALLAQVIYRMIPEESARMLALDTGEVQMVMAPAPSQLDIYRDPAFTEHETPGVRIFFGLMTARTAERCTSALGAKLRAGSAVNIG